MLMGIVIAYFGRHEFKLFILVQRKLIGCGFKLSFGAVRLGCVVRMGPSKGLNTETGDGHRDSFGCCCGYRV
jgi:hypothetical protein